MLLFTAVRVTYLLYYQVSEQETSHASEYTSGLDLGASYDK